MRALLLTLSLSLLGFGCSAPAPRPTPVSPPVVETGMRVTSSPNLRNLSITPGQKITSPIILTGEARKWYFEASFPVRLVDANGKTVADTYAQAEGEWMTTEFVPFRSTLTFPKPATATGSILFMKDNPTGEARFDEQVAVPVAF